MKPHFPEPASREPYRSEPRPAVAPASDASVPVVVVSRAEPPPAVSQGEVTTEKAPLKLTQEEIRALLAVDAARRTPVQVATKRGRMLLLPLGAIELGARFFFGDWATLIGVAVFVLALAWTARPLFGSRDW